MKLVDGTMSRPSRLEVPTRSFAAHQYATDRQLGRLLSVHSPSWAKGVRIPDRGDSTGTHVG